MAASRQIRAGAELLAMFAEDQATVGAFLADAESHRRRYARAQALVSDTPWPYVLLEWSPLEDAPATARRVVDVVRTHTARFLIPLPCRRLLSCLPVLFPGGRMRIASREVSGVGLAVGVVAAAGCVYQLFALWHPWQVRVFLVGFLACIGSVLFLVQYLRRRRDLVTVAVFVVTVVVLAVMTAIDSYSTRFYLVTGVVMFVAGVASATVVGVRARRAGGHVPDGGGSAGVVPRS
jgi:hypothetical protein